LLIITLNNLSLDVFVCTTKLHCVSAVDVSTMFAIKKLANFDFLALFPKFISQCFEVCHGRIMLVASTLV